MRTERGLERLVTFLDAVVAIAITLLVLPLVDIAGEPSDADAGTVLADHVPELVVLVLSFLVIARLWIAHHKLLEHAGSYDEAFLWANFAWAFTIVVLPFATELTTRGTHDDRVALAVYIGTMAVSALCLAAIALLLDRRPALRREDDEGRVRVRPTVVSFCSFLVALVLGLAVPGVGYWGLLLLAVDDRVARLLLRRPAGD